MSDNMRIGAENKQCKDELDNLARKLLAEHTQPEREKLTSQLLSDFAQREREKLTPQKLAAQSQSERESFTPLQFRSKPEKKNYLLGTAGGMMAGFGTRALMQATPYLARFGVAGKFAAATLPFVAAGVTSDFLSDGKLGSPGEMALGAGSYGIGLLVWKAAHPPSADYQKYLKDFVPSKTSRASKSLSSAPADHWMGDPSHPLSPLNPANPASPLSILNPSNPMSIYRGY